MVLEKAEEKIVAYDGDKTPDGIAWRYWKQFVKKGYMPEHVDVEIEYALFCIVHDFAPFVHWFYSVGDLTRFAIKSYLFGNDKMEAEVTDYLNTASREDNQHFVDYYSEQPLIVQALYLRFIKEVIYRKSRGLHESDNIVTAFTAAVTKIAKRVHMTTDEFIERRFLPFLAEKRKKSARQFYKLYTGKSLPKKNF